MYIQTVYRPEENVDYLQDWLTHHVAIGVTHFYLYDNGGANAYIDTDYYIPPNYTKHGVKIEYSVDEARKREQDIIKNFPVTKIMWQNKDSNGKLLYNQAEAIVHFKNLIREGLCAFIDIDEFIIKKEEFRVCRMYQRKFKSRAFYKSVYDCRETLDVDTSQWAPKVILDLANFPEFDEQTHNIHFHHLDLPISLSYFNHYNHTKFCHEYMITRMMDQVDPNGTANIDTNYDTAFYSTQDTGLCK